MANIDYRNLRRLPPNATLNDGDLITIQPLGATEPVTMTWGKFKTLAGSGGGGTWGTVGGSLSNQTDLSNALLLKEDALLTDVAMVGTGTTTLTFDRNKIYSRVPQTGNMALQLAGGGNTIGKENVLIIDGNSTNTFSFPEPSAGWINGNGVLFDNTKRNVIFLRYIEGQVIYNISNSAIPSIDVIAPSFQTASVTNSTPNKITLQYSETLNNTFVPGISAFSLTGGKTVTGITLLGSTVELNTSPNFVNGESILVSYIVPVSNRIRDIAGNFAIAFSNQSIQNNVLIVDTTAPTLTSTQVTSQGNQIILTYSEPLLTTSVPTGGDFTLSPANGISGVNVSDVNVILTLTGSYINTDVVTLSYTRGINKLKDLVGNEALNFSNYSVNNSQVLTAQDNFNSANISELNNRVTPIGSKTWTKTANGVAGSSAGIVNSMLKLTAGSSVEYIIDAGKRNNDITVTVGQVGAIGGALIVFLYTGTSPSFNYCYLTQNYEIKMWSNSVNSTIYAGNGTSWTNGDVIRMVIGATTLTLYKNGVQLYSGTAAGSQAGTKLGMSFYEDFVVSFDSISIL